MLHEASFQQKSSPRNGLSADPAEVGTTFGTGHLVAPSRLLDHGTAFGAGLNVLMDTHPQEALKSLRKDHEKEFQKS